MPRSQSVLVLDDDPEICLEVADFLASAGHRVSTAGDASVLQSDEFQGVDVMILDLGLPSVDGVDVLRQLAAMMRAPGVIVMSGHGQSVLHAASYAAERTGLRLLGVMEKPVDADRLLALVESDAPGRRRQAGGSMPVELVLPSLLRALDERLLEINLQPKVTVREMRFAGAEALLANSLPGIARISPPDIVAAAASEPGLLVRLTHEVTRQAMLACAEWTHAGWSGPVSVNVPIEALISEDAIAALLAISKTVDLPPSQLTLELVEDSLYDSSAQVVATLAKLRIAGFGLALDDVGKRQSGLLQLANLPVTEIKIDLEIVRQARSWEKARGIFASLADLGHRIGTKVVAEGVELPIDLELVRQHPVDYIQGYIVSGKLPVNELLLMLPGLGAAASKSSAFDVRHESNDSA
jgi:EAL domain-containing protein (putative c-di-GMP-specific phosphodiesterase class I)/ActR/RegA family two-component response regulator